MSRLLPVLVSLCMVITTMSLSAWAEPVECPNCWRMVDEGPCMCPYCEHQLPDRTCPPPEPEPAKQPPVPTGPPPGDAQEDGPQKQGKQRRPQKRRRPRQVKGQGGSDDQGTKRPQKRRRPRAEGDDTDRPTTKRRRVQGDDRPTKRRRVQGDDRPTKRRRVQGDDRPTKRRRVQGDDRPRRRPQEGQRRRRPPPREEEEDPVGPSLLVGYRYSGMYHWREGGHVHGVSLEGFPLASMVPWFRLGLGAELAFRVVGEEHTDWTTRGFATIGFQYPHRRATPYGSLNVGGGMGFRQRFGQGIVDGMLAVGVDGGATFRLTSTFVSDLCLGYLYVRLAGINFHSFTLRVSVGW